ncbi:MAG TPA: hypothetical protein VN831_12140, partial [Bradyrhizobium sp.]|nr:hypothetical protein [Bradyrhizobium sp.]
TSARMIGGILVRSFFLRCNSSKVIPRNAGNWWTRQQPNLFLLGAKHAIDDKAFEVSGQLAERIAHIGD